jgi:hypothetical protein
MASVFETNQWPKVPRARTMSRAASAAKAEPTSGAPASSAVGAADHIPIAAAEEDPFSQLAERSPQLSAGGAVPTTEVSAAPAVLLDHHGSMQQLEDSVHTISVHLQAMSEQLQQLGRQVEQCSMQQEAAGRVTHTHSMADEGPSPAWFAPFGESISAQTFKIQALEAQLQEHASAVTMSHPKSDDEGWYCASFQEHAVLPTLDTATGCM